MSHTVETFVSLESQVWEALRIGDPQRDAALLTEDFLGVYETGFSDRQNHCDQLKNGPIVARYAITDPRITVLSEEIVLLAYLAEWSRPASPESTEYMYISSIWRRSGSGWRNIFSQDTRSTAC